MKHISTLLLIIITLSPIYGQNSWSLDWGVGTQFLATPGSNTNPDIYAEVTGRRMFKGGIFGWQATYNYNELDSSIPELYNVKVHSGYTGPVVNVGRWMDFQDFTRTWTIFANIGVGGSRYVADITPDHATFDIAGGISVVKKIGDNVSLRLNWTRVANLNQQHAFDNQQWIMSDIADSYRDGISIGAIFNIGKSKDNRDWYIEPDITYSETKVSKDKPEVFPYVVNEYNCNDCEEDDKIFTGYLYFAEGSDTLEGFWNMEVLRAATEFAAENRHYRGWADGYACGTHGSEEVNCGHSKARAEEVKRLLRNELNHRSILMAIRAKGNCVDTDFKHIGINKRVKLVIKPVR